MSCCNDRTIKIVLPPSACPDSGTYTASNANVTGEGVFFQQDGNDFQFYGITNDDGYLTVTLDATNKAIVINLDTDLINGSIPDATETVKGKAELATQAETNAGADDTRIVTPLKLAGRTASTSQTGLVELATNAETTTGTDTTRAVVPAGLKAATDLLTIQDVAANAVVRDGKTPRFAGQLLPQLDTGVLYYATSTSPGAYSLAALPLTGTANVSALTISGDVVFQVSTTLGGVVNLLQATTVLQIDGTDVPADSLICTTGTSGVPSSTQILNFVSGFNTDQYTLGTYTTRFTVPNAATGTLEQLYDVVSTLLQTLFDTKKPTPSI